MPRSGFTITVMNAEDAHLDAVDAPEQTSDPSCDPLLTDMEVGIGKAMAHLEVSHSERLRPEKPLRFHVLW